MYNQQNYTMDTKTYAEKFWNGMRGNLSAVNGLVTTKHCPTGAMTCHYPITIGLWRP